MIESQKLKWCVGNVIHILLTYQLRQIQQVLESYQQLPKIVVQVEVKPGPVVQHQPL